MMVDITGLGQAQTCCEAIPVTEVPTIHSW